MYMHSLLDIYCLLVSMHIYVQSILYMIWPPTMTTLRTVQGKFVGFPGGFKHLIKSKANSYFNSYNHYMHYTDFDNQKIVFL